MKYAVAVLAAAAGVSANWAPNATVVTEVVDVYTTYCPGPTEITHGGKTWTVTEATTLTITDCPCTITKPVVPTSVVVCNTCGPNNNGTGVVPPVTATQPPVVTGGNPPPATQTPEQPGQPPVEGSAGKAVAGLAGVFGLAALVL